MNALHQCTRCMGMQAVWFIRSHSHAAVHQRGCDDKWNTELRLINRRGTCIAGDVQRRLVRADPDAVDLVGAKAVEALQLQCAVDRGEAVAAANMVLEGGTRDVEVAS